MREKNAESYYAYGISAARQAPAAAAQAFYWASRLDPTRADALFARYLLPQRFNGIGFHIIGGKTYIDPSLDAEMKQHIDSLAYLAMVRDSFVHDQLRYDSPPADSFYIGHRLKDPAFAGEMAYREERFQEAAVQWARALKQHPNAVVIRTARARAPPHPGIRESDPSVRRRRWSLPRAAASHHS